MCTASSTTSSSASWPPSTATAASPSTLDLRKSRAVAPAPDAVLRPQRRRVVRGAGRGGRGIRADGATQLLVNGHSTGGLATALWAHARRDDTLLRPDALFLNSPFLSLNAAPLVRAAGATLAALRRAARSLRGDAGRAVGAACPEHPQRPPRRVDARPRVDGRGRRVRAGWLRAVHAAHRRRARARRARPDPRDVRGLQQRRSSGTRSCCAATACSTPSRSPAARRAAVTYVRIDDGMHDLVLSAEPVRAQVYAELERWLDAYVLS